MCLMIIWFIYKNQKPLKDCTMCRLLKNLFKLGNIIEEQCVMVGFSCPQTLLERAFCFARFSMVISR